jgi:HD-GYP domain-containing protein (c-di-GMP phosphodiesterase class II)
MFEKDKLKEVDVNFLKTGSILSGILFDEKGTMLWPARKPLTDVFISKLKVKGIERVYYVPPKWKSEGEQTPLFSTESLTFAQEALDEMVTQIKFGKIPELKNARLTIEKLFHDMELNTNGFLNLMVLKDYDTYTYTHSINVGLLSMFLTKQLGFNTYFVQEIGLGGFLHDIGKIKIPTKIVNKHGNLTDDEFKIMKNHPVYGFKLVKDDPSLSNYVKKVVLFHHEKWAGGGYPLGLKADAIGNFAQIVAVSDVYDALTTERSYKKPYSINDALLYIMRNTNTHFCSYISQRFIYEMSLRYELGSFYPVGAFVQLTTGEIGYITGKDKEYTMKPEVAILKNQKGVPLRVPIQIDLKRDTSRQIAKTIDEPEEIEKLSYLL